MSTSQASIPERTYRSYTNATLDTPLLHLLLSPCVQALQPLLSILYKIRWLLGYPLSTRIIPKCIPVPSSINVTVGELVLMLPLVVWFLLGYESSEVKPNVDTSGGYATFCVVYTFLTANKSNSLFSFLFGIPFERMIGLHQLSTVFAIVLGCLHARTAHRLDGSPGIWSYFFDNDENLTGFIGLAAMSGLFLTSVIPQLRRVLFNAWLVIHFILIIATLVGLFLHEATLVVFVGIWWVLDLLIRYVIQAGCTHRVKAVLRRVGDSPATNEPAVEIKFRKPCDFNAGQFVQIALPKLSIFEFHPFTVSSAPHEEFMTLHIRQLGNWTKRLLDLADSSAGQEVDVWLEGPYGNLSVDLDDDSKYKMALLVSGGIGVTPMQSIGKSLLHQHHQEGRNLKYLKYVWAVRDLKIVDDLKPLGGEQDFSKQSTWYRRQSSLIQSRKSFTTGSDNNSSNFMRRQSGSSTKPKARLPAVAQVDVYCTRGKPPAEDDSEEPRKYNLQGGRPDLEAIFAELKETAIGLGEHNVAVFGCGPTLMMEDLKRMCRKHSQSVLSCGSQGVFFDLHLDHFEF